MSQEPKLEGIRRETTEAWLAANVDDLRPPFHWTRLTGGTSNLTYAVEAGNGRRVVVRRPPTGKLLPKAHDMGREFKIISGLASTPVPVAQPLGHCTDPEVTGAPFYVMEFCEGRIVRDTLGTLHPMSPSARVRLGESIIDSLVALHALEPAEIGLGDLGRPDAYIARQLNRWLDSWNKSHDSAQLDLPTVAECYGILSARIPEQGPGRVVHGDYGLHNMLIDDEGQVVALTDWEISTLGDPLADLAYLANGWSLGPGEAEVPYAEGRVDDGYATRAELIARYEEKSARKLGDLPFYIAFNYFKTTCIVQGVYARFRRGVRSTQGLNLDALRERIVRSARATELTTAAL
jgi:aminoglycoside phosphotransferase (APT) family kinase protein